MKAKMDIHQEMETAIHSIRFELEETIKRRMEDVPLCVIQKTQGLRRELTENDDIQLDLKGHAPGRDPDNEGPN
jgi:hypothetical protein